MKPARVFRTRSRIWPRFLSGRALFGILAACLLGAVAGPAIVKADATLPVTGAEPGATNPVGAADTNMFRDDELNIWGTNSDAWEARFIPGAPAKDDLSAWNLYFNTIEAGPIMAVDHGRVIDPQHDEVVAARFDSNNDIHVDVRRADTGTTTRSFVLHYRATGPPMDGIDVAVGDLDRVVDESGYLHDEIVVVWGRSGLYGGCTAAIDILDNYWGEIPEARQPVSGCTGRVAAAIGDFNVDGNLELVAVTNDGTTLQAQVCSLTLESPGNPPKWNLDCLPEYAMENPEGFPSLDVAAGNVLGLGKEEIIIVTSPDAASSSNQFRMTILGLDPADGYQTLGLERTFLSTNTQVGGSSIPGAHEVRVQTGLFRYDPAKGYDFGNRQIVTAALGASSGNQTADLWFWDIPDPDEPALVLAKSHTQISGRHTAKPSLAVGNFVGHGVNDDQNDPTMQAALTYLHTTSDNLADATKVTQKTSVWQLAPSSSDLSTWTAPQVWSYSFAANHGFDGYDPHVVTTDYDGDSWRLGLPIHIAINGSISYNSLLEEPPKHVDYLPVDPDDLSKGYDVVNISGYKTFYVALKQMSGESISTQKTDTTDRTLGGGLDLSADFQVNLGRANNPKVRLDVNGEGKISGSYEDSTKDIKSHYLSKSVTWTNSTDADDELDVSIQDMDIWRYPIIGFQTGDASNPQGYYEIEIPGQTYETQQGGKQFDWYAPLHVNNNVLSYPQTRTSQMPWVPSDVGSFQVPELDAEGNPIVDDKGNPVFRTVTGLMADEVVYTWDGNKHSQEMQFSKSDSTSHQTSFTSTIGGSVDIGAGISSRIRIPEPGVPLSFTLDLKGKLSFNGKTSWGGETIGSMQMSKSSGVSLEIPPIIGFSQEGRSYSFASAVYSSTNGGGPKVAHTVVGLVDHPQDWWVEQYGRAPDPALNLPFLFRQKDPDPQHANLNWWELKTAENDPFDTRHQMRGFLMYNNDRDPTTGEYELFDGNPVDGEIVRLCARVYNLSLGQATGNFGADFYYYGWNTKTGKYADPRTGEEVYELFHIGTASVANLDSLSTSNGVTMREVCVPWDTTGLSQVADPDIRYRFLVNLDEKDEVKGEIHELEDADGNEPPAGNNSGRWPWMDGILVESPAQASSAAGGLRLVNGVLEDTSLDVNLRPMEGEIALETAAGMLDEDPMVVGAGEPCRIRIHVVSDSSYSGNVWVAFFDGKPLEGGKLLALQLLRGVQQGDNYAWADWTPSTSGEHELRVYAFHRVSLANREGGATSRMVTVESAPNEGGGGGGGGCSILAGRGTTVFGPAGLILLGFAWLGFWNHKRRCGRN